MPRRAFDISYLNEMTKTFWSTTQAMLRYGDEEMVSSYVHSILGRVGLQLNELGRAQRLDLHYLCRMEPDVDREELRDFGQEASALDKRRMLVASVEDLREWTVAAEDLIGRLSKRCPSLCAEAKARDLKRWVESASLLLKRRALESVMFSAGSYCIFRNRPRLMAVLVDSNQPEDTTTSWMGWDPFPRDLRAIVQRYVLRLGRDDFGHDFGEGHHDNEHYDQEFAAYLLIRTVVGQRREAVSANGLDAGISETTTPEPLRVDFSFDGMSASEVSNVDWVVDRLAEATVRLASKREVLDTLKVPAQLKDDILTSWMPSFLASLKEAKERHLDRLVVSTPMSREKVASFADKVRSQVESDDALREFFRFLGRYEERLGEAPGSTSPFGVNTLADKAMFFEDWFIHYDMFEDGIAEAMVKGETEKVLGWLAAAATATDESIEWCVTNLKQDAQPVILTPRLFDPRSALDMEKFVPAHMREASDQQFPEELQLAGWYQAGEDLFLPVLEFWQLHRLGTLVVDAKRLGRWTQYDPNPKDSTRGEVHGFLSILVGEVSEHPDLVDDLKTKKSKWVVERPTWMTEEDVMRTRVWLRVLERFSYSPEEGVGFLLTKDAESDGLDAEVEE